MEAEMDIPMYVAYSPEKDQRVQVYRNLTKRCWSVRHKGRVIAHAVAVYLKDCTFKVQEGGRKRVLRERRKNVHAFVEGYGEHEYQPVGSVVQRVVYNPYKMSTFQTDAGVEARSAESVWFTSSGTLLAHGVR